ncbi:MAG: cation diffusion facilitator family transporter [Streptococcaceae bacterium]|jgi:cation diffusion facilitator family transporter|nr:cation diffusion facilitator family transporter [Streptococcaceae bacterium]
MEKNARVHDLRLAERGVWVSIGAYIVLAAANVIVAELTHSASLRANGLDNVTDVLANIAILIGLRVARVPADSDHVYGHWKVESIAALLSSFLMAFVGFEVLQSTIERMVSRVQVSVDAIGAWVGVFSAVVIFSVYLYTRRLARQVSSEALRAAARDNLADSVTSLGTAVAVVAASLHWVLIDQVMALVIAGFIFKTAYDIFRDSAFSLTDGFDENLLVAYEEAIRGVDKVSEVKMLRGRTYGSHIFLDVVVAMSPDLSVYESHAATEEIERVLRERFDVFDTDVHVEPALLSEEEQEAALLLKLQKLEEADYADFSGFSQFESQRISEKTFLLRYVSSGQQVIAIWRRNNIWQCVFRESFQKAEA